LRSKIKTREGKIFLDKKFNIDNSTELEMKMFVKDVHNNIEELIKKAYKAILSDIKKEKNFPIHN
jgi:hypothetical protein